MKPSPTRVLFCCTGVGIHNRGIESFFREAFDGLKGTCGLETRLLKGGGSDTTSESRAWCLPRNGQSAKTLGKLVRRNAYVIEQLTSFPSVVGYVRRFRPEVIFYSDANLGFQLFRWRKQIGVPFRLLFSNGGPCRPPFDRTDFVHQVTPYYHAEAIRSGEAAQRHYMVPYGIDVGSAPVVNIRARRELRRRLSIPQERAVILSVGWISREHKRMHYLVEEVARLPQPRPFLQMLGAMDGSSDEIVNLASRLLGDDGFSARSVPFECVSDYYRAADVFALASLREGFGRVYLEALIHGLPVIAHRHPVMEYVLGPVGYLADLNIKGELACLASRLLAEPPDQTRAFRCWDSARERFSWTSLAPAYAAMFRAVAA